MTIFDIITNASPLILIIGSCIGFFYYKNLDSIHRSIVWYLIVMLCVDIVSRIIGSSGNNLIMFLIYSLIELIMIVFFYYKFLFKAKHRIVMGLSIIAVFYIIFEIIEFDNKDLKSFQPYSKVADNFIVILLSLAFFQERITMFKDSKWEHFGLNIAILIFFTISLIIYLPFNFLINESTGLKFYFLQGVLIIMLIFYIYLTYCIWNNAKEVNKFQKKKILS